jgi:large subunit ribosomal protein L14
MIFSGTKLKVADNSGAKLVKCIKVLGLGLKKAGFIGDLLLVTIKKVGKKRIKKKNNLSWFTYYG